MRACNLFRVCAILLFTTHCLYIFFLLVLDQKIELLSNVADQLKCSKAINNGGMHALHMHAEVLHNHQICNKNKAIFHKSINYLKYELLLYNQHSLTLALSPCVTLSHQK